MLTGLKKKGKFILVAIVFGIIPMSSGFAETMRDANLEEAKGIIKEFFSSLKTKLETALSEGGPASAGYARKGHRPLPQSIPPRPAGMWGAPA